MTNFPYEDRAGSGRGRHGTATPQDNASKENSVNNSACAELLHLNACAKQLNISD
jgi:hypothetical protein